MPGESPFAAAALPTPHARVLAECDGMWPVGDTFGKGYNTVDPVQPYRQKCRSSMTMGLATP